MSQEQARAEQARERETHLKHNREQETINQIFQDSAIKFKVAPAEVLRTIGTVRFVDGVPVVVDGGRPLSAVLEDVARVNPMLVAGSWQESHKPESEIRSKSDLKTPKDKSDYITRFGYDSFARLPQTAPDIAPGVPESYASYLRLPMSERSKLLGTQGPDWLARLQHKAGEQQRFDRLVGVPTGSRR